MENLISAFGAFKSEQRSMPHDVYAFVCYRLGNVSHSRGCQSIFVPQTISRIVVSSEKARPPANASTALFTSLSAS